ncbi:M48 family metallopeptidase [Haloarcula marina]|uniref:M48 family metallopeptidase n=1 Tax=Haloarcula marina TaxID=2961574 RepID=UPI0020B7F158|nr:M48 family metalloprotease [Halomicroarcula marina]
MDTATWRSVHLRMLAVLAVFVAVLLVVPVVVLVVALFLSTATLVVLAIAVDALVSSVASMPTISPMWWAVAFALLTVVWTGVVVSNVFGASLSADGSVLSGMPTERPDSADGRELVRTVERLAQQADCQPPDVVLTNAAVGGAMTVGLRPSDSTLVVSRRALETLTEAERRAVVAHEIAHLKNRDAAVLTLASKPLFLLDEATRSQADYERTVPELMAAALSAMLVAWLSRTRERYADSGAVAITGDPAALATALERLRDAESGPETDVRALGEAAFGVVPPTDERRVDYDRSRNRPPVFWSARKRYRELVAALEATHPSTEERITRLRALERASEGTAGD